MEYGPGTAWAEVTMRKGAGMVGRKLDAQAAESAVLGSAILGGGSGAKTETGIRLGQMAVEVGDAFLVQVDDLSPDAEIVAVATFGNLIEERVSYRFSYHNLAIQLLELNTGTAFAGLSSCGRGALDMMAGWGQAALLDIPLIDAAFDRRAHPHAVKGFINLLAGSIGTIPLAVVGRKAEDDERLEVFLRGSHQSAINVVEWLTALGGTYALSIGPLPPGWTEKESNHHHVSRAIEVGEAMLRAGGDGGRMVASALSQVLGGKVVAFGTVTDVSWKREDDGCRGTLHIRDEEGRSLELRHRHCYVSLDVDGERVAAFPDLVVTLGAKGTPLHAGELTEGQNLYIVVSSATKSNRTANVSGRPSHRDLTTVPGRPAIVSHSSGEDL